MTKKTLQFGEWSGGVNHIDETSDVARNELTEGINIELTPKGSVRLRRPIRVIDSGADFKLLGESPLLSTELDKNIGSGVLYRKGTEIYLVFPDVAWGTVTKSLLGTLHNKIDYAFTYGGRYWLLSTDIAQPSYVSDSIGPGAKTWSAYTTQGPTSGKLYCDTYAVYLDRLFVAVDDIVYYSVAGDFLDWSIQNGGGSFTVGTASGNRINFFHVMYNVLYIFTKYETFAYTYGTSPNVDPSLQAVSKQGSNTGLFYRDKLYCISDYGLYKFVNNIYYELKVKEEFKFYGVTNIQGFDDNLILGSTIPTNKWFVINTDSSAVVEWEAGTSLISSNRGTTNNFIIYTEGLLYTYLLSIIDDTMVIIPFRYQDIPEDQFYDSGSAPGKLRPYTVEFVTRLEDFGTNGVYTRIYYCTSDAESYGYYDGELRIFDTQKKDGGVKLGMHVTSDTKMAYPLSRSRAVQPRIVYKSTTANEVTTPGQLPISFNLTNLQLLVEAKDMQQGERQ